MTKDAWDEKLNGDLNGDGYLSQGEVLANPAAVGLSEREYGIAEVLDDEAHRSRLRNIVTETIFTDLLNTDDFLKQQDPEAVLEAYNDILEVAPELVGKKMMLRQALRQYMASETLDLPTIGQITNLGEQIRKKNDERLKRDADAARSYAEFRQKRHIDLTKLDNEAKKLKIDKEKADAAKKALESDTKNKKYEAKVMEEIAKKDRDQKNKELAWNKKKDVADFKLRQNTEALNAAIARLRENREERMFPLVMAGNLPGVAKAEKLYSSKKNNPFVSRGHGLVGVPKTLGSALSEWNTVASTPSTTIPELETVELTAK